MGSYRKIRGGYHFVGINLRVQNWMAYAPESCGQIGFRCLRG